MKFSAVATSLFCAVVALAQTPGFTINTPTNPVQCQPLLISWVGGQGPFFLLMGFDHSVHNGDDPSGPAIADLGEQPAGATSFSWQHVTFQANTRLGFSLRDQSGATAQSAAVTVQAGPDNSCLNGGSSSSGSDSAPGTTAASTTSAAAPGTTSTSAPAVPITTAPGTSSTTAAVTSGASTSVPRPSSVTTSSGTAAPAQTSNAASAQVAKIGAAGFVGAALVAILA